MYGTEKKKFEPFRFDLELELKENPKRAQELLAGSQEHIQTIKKALRTGVDETEFERLGIVLNGYAALQKVLKRIGK